jgi:hypothetical protein
MQNKNQPAGLVCPHYNSFVEVSIQALLSQASIQCPFCMTTISLDRNKSKEALDLLQKINGAVDNLEVTTD